MIVPFSRIFRILSILFLLVTAGSPAVAYDPLSAPVQQADLLDGPVVARVYYQERANLEQLAARLDIWEVHPEEGYLLAMLTPQQYAALEQSGYRLEIDQGRTGMLNQPLVALPGQGTDSIPGFPCYRTVEETFTDMSAIAASHPTIAEWMDIGNSWDKVTAGGPIGYDILALRLTNEAAPTPIAERPTFILMAAIHARELVTAETAARYAEYLVDNYGIDPDITWLLDYYKVYIVTITNPDGRKFAEQGLWWRKNTDNVAGGGCSFPDYGVDLNRNHSFHWGGAGTSPCDETYQGPAGASEPEVLAIQILALINFPDQRGPGDEDPAPPDTTGLLISLHSFSELVLWPYGFRSQDAPNHIQLQTLGRRFAYYNHYTPQQSNDLYPTTGTSDDWAYGVLGIAAYTFEMGTDFFQSCSTFENTVYPDNLPALLYAFKAARHPYMDPAGPESLNAAVNPSTPVTPGTPVHLTATANDTRFSAGEPTQAVNEARYSIDNPSWIPGTPTYPMTAVDGSFNSNIENIQATIDTTGLIGGRHIVFVESKDASNNWGVPGAVFLEIDATNYGVSLTPTQAFAQAAPGATVQYTMTIQNSGALADTYDVSLASAWTASAPATVGPVAPGTFVSFNVQVTIPLNAAPGASDSAVVTVTSQGDPGISDSSTLTTRTFFRMVYLPLATKQ